jgi:uridine kinase
MRLKCPLGRSQELLRQVHAALTPEWRKLLICIDGANGLGKSSLALWFAWQLGAVAIHLDLYVVPDSHPLRWRTDDLQRAIDARLRVGPAIVEGVLALNALDALKRSQDFLIFVEGDSSSLRLASEIEAYNVHQRPRDRANFTLLTRRTYLTMHRRR